MREPTKISFKEWWRYEIRTFKRAWSEIRMSVFLRGGAVAIFTAALTYCGLLAAGVSGKPELVIRYSVTACAGIAAFILVFSFEFLVKLFGAPAKMMNESGASLGRLETKFQERIDELTSAHTKHAASLESQIQALKSELDERSKQKENEKTLGNYHIMLSDRAREDRKSVV